MRTNIDIDETLVAQAMKLGGLTTKKDAVEAALQMYVRRHKQVEAFEALKGIGWDGNLDAMRLGLPDHAGE